MKFSRHRLIGLPAFALLITAAGCSSADDSSSVAVPSPSEAVTKLCRNLDKALPRTVDGLSRNDPEPESALTAGWGSPVIILRCGVVRPPKMIDPKVAEGRDADAVAGGVNGVDWLQEAQDGGYRFTSANRKAYVEVSVPEGRDSAAVLVDLASAVKSAIPVGIAD
ncbi:DUF3515 domain-containing protein [Streptomyces spinoverrucosus]|uniref:DUF3515 domain-containing protein n=1 Tax=Streptomyces spinoverrucosus TaxID=284043 RepID=UPI0018C3D7C0|nr:DUF3515 domain-containing protein [Streptomyces spinoverrucosus]MBG0852271.1 DUF3515 domain-containing protein [Streptomyces spinoverrucosus]